ncbi:MAG: ATP-dependent zinc metalloprotease FtsH 1 [Candidatus Kaiserbacteria bacterium GW2011_GWC2_52_8b]|uniref:ATP-dependent zinc metalloprotease FtsH 1 n=1 Tax=Candidatus Kaiserbacteria bacterium GW2011_GWC2_52_8b TaxID=1618676 RepID=A0A0G1ZMJ5_9BACT|nr:MAG: ATP-dependent zinc metalloprotease FtsH 1 [Candidatus Kaiserbacteria bacterium GW2011_GWC2_52_8b]
MFKDVTTGAANDLQTASEIARALVKEYGMSKKLGPVTFGETVTLGPFMQEGGSQPYSDAVAAEIDREVSLLIGQANKTAERILRQRRTMLAKLARILIEKETIEREEFDKIVGKSSGKHNTRV